MFWGVLITGLHDGRGQVTNLARLLGKLLGLLCLYAIVLLHHL